jgi:hypothetical protein
MGRILPYMKWKIKSHVPNNQPDIFFHFLEIPRSWWISHGENPGISQMFFLSWNDKLVELN